MFNVFHNHDKVERLQAILDRIVSTGTISMESADLIEREIPGAIHSIDPDIMFDVDESEEGVGVALEASIEGLSRMKIAFIVAIVAFIAKYIMSLNKSYTFSSSGGGSGGWGGSASPGFSTDAPASTAKHWEDEKQYNETINEDLAKLHSDFSESYKKLKSQGINNNILGGMEKNAALKRLCNTLIPTIIRNNQLEGTGTEAKGFTLFSAGASRGNMIAEVHLKPFTDVSDKNADVTTDQIKRLQGILNLIDTKYTVKEIFTNQYRDSNSEHQPINKVNGLLIPTFLLDQELQVMTLDLIKAITKMVDNLDRVNSDLNNFREVISSAEQSKPDLMMGGAYADKLWKWLADNLGKNASSGTIIRSYLDDIINTLKLKTDQGEYINTPAMNTSLKRFVRVSIDGVESSGDGTVEEFVSNINAGDVEGTVALITGATGDISTKLTPLLPIFDSVKESLSDKENNINEIKKIAESLEETMQTVVYFMRQNERKSGLEANKLASDSSLDSRGRDKLENYYDGNGDETTKNQAQLLKNITPMFSLVSGLIQVILMSMASAAKYNTELNKFSQARIDLIIGKKQQMAKELYELTKTIDQIIEASQNRS